FPPVQTNLLRFVDTAYEQTDSDRQQLDIRQGDPNISSDHEPFIKNSVENIQKIGCSGNSWNSLHNISGKYRRDRLEAVETRTTHAPHPNYPPLQLSTPHRFLLTQRASFRYSGRESKRG